MGKGDRTVTGHRELPEEVESSVFSASLALELVPPATASSLTAALRGWIVEIQDWARGKGLLVGHVKVLVESDTGYFRLSGTGGAVTSNVSESWEPSRVGPFEVKVAAIIVGFTPREFEELAGNTLERALSRLLPER